MVGRGLAGCDLVGRCTDRPGSRGGRVLARSGTSRRVEARPGMAVKERHVSVGHDVAALGTVGRGSHGSGLVRYVGARYGKLRHGSHGEAGHGEPGFRFGMARSGSRGVAWSGESRQVVARSGAGLAWQSRKGAAVPEMARHGLRRQGEIWSVKAGLGSLGTASLVEGNDRTWPGEQRRGSRGAT